MGSLRPTLWREVVILLMCAISMSLSVHEQCWNCSSECSRCVRGSVPVDTVVSEFYSGLFSAVPPSDSFMHTKTLRSSSTVTRTRHATRPPGVYGCCETEMFYDKMNTTSINGRDYNVVQLKGLFQFVPIGVCKGGPPCSMGECVQNYRAHWILVYDNTTILSHPPLKFVSIRVKSHCECMNVGRAKR